MSPSLIFASPILYFHEWFLVFTSWYIRMRTLISAGKSNGFVHIFIPLADSVSAARCLRPDLQKQNNIVKNVRAILFRERLAINFMIFVICEWMTSQSSLLSGKSVFKYTRSQLKIAFSNRGIAASFLWFGEIATFGGSHPYHVLNHWHKAFLTSRHWYSTIWTNNVTRDRYTRTVGVGVVYLQIVSVAEKVGLTVVLWALLSA